MRWLTLAATSLVFAQTPTFRTNTRLVEVSVVVYDRAGNPVRDLTAADFKLFEEGTQQSIELFSIEAAAAAAVGSPTVAVPSTFSNRPGGRRGGSVTVVLFDRLNTEFEHQMQARNQIIKVLAALPPTDRVALYVLESDSIRVLHDFTTDARGLVRVLSRYLGMTSIELDAAQGLPEFVRTGDAAFDAETEAWLAQTQERISAFYTKRRGEFTTDALEAIGNHLAGIGGRKNLVWVSSAFPLVFNDVAGPRNLTPEINRATRAITSADVAVYPVDARGLIGAFAGNPADRQQTFSTLSTVSPNMDSMRTIAENTGGRAYVNTNAIGDAVRRAMDDARVTYVLGYYPTHNKWDGKFRAIKVDVNRGRLDVRHRRGYLAIGPQPTQPPAGRAEALTATVRGSLEATGIGLTATIDRIDGEPSSHSLVIQVDAQSLTWDKRGDEWAAALDVLIGQTHPDGRFLKTMDTTVNLSANADRYAQLMREGFTLTHKVALHETANRVHVVVRDPSSRTTGSLIIPTSRIQR